MSAGLSLEHLARAEVVGLHEFFVAWFRSGGAAPDFGLCEGAFAPDFRMIAPEGDAHDRTAVMRRIREARGVLTSDFRIDILGPRPVWMADEAVLLEYVEQQYRDGRSTRRRSTGLFTRCPSAPRGVQWLHLQETWMGAAADT